jgi:hypothetical protein
MITKEEARRRALAYIEERPSAHAHEMVLVDALTQEEDFGWVFFYDSKRHVETGDRQWALGGNAPLIVDRRTGELHVTGTALPTEHYIAVYRRDGHLQRAHENAATLRTLTHVPDLVECKLPEIADTSNLRAVGWLARWHDYARGEVSAEFMGALVGLLVEPWQPLEYDGVHQCPFCRFTGGPGTVRFGFTTVSVGNSNLFVPAKDVIYVAPSLIAHYVDAHDYAPPEQFQQAVLTCPAMRSFAYLKAIRERSRSLVAARRGDRLP